MTRAPVAFSRMPTEAAQDCVKLELNKDFASLEPEQG